MSLLASSGQWWTPTFSILSDCTAMEYLRVDVPLGSTSTSLSPDGNTTFGCQLESLYSVVNAMPRSTKVLDLFFDIPQHIRGSVAETLSLRVDWHLLGLYLKTKPDLVSVVLHFSRSTIYSGSSYAAAEIKAKEEFVAAGLKDSDST